MAQFDGMISGHEEALDDRASVFRLRSIPQQDKADEISRVARELTKAANEQRLATAGRLRAARLEKAAGKGLAQGQTDQHLFGGQI